MMCVNDNEALGAELVSIAYFFSAWGDRAWEFASFMFILEVFPSTLLPASFFGFMEVFAGILTGSRIGQFVDNHDRLVSMRTSVLCQNAGVAAASILFYTAIQNKTSWTIGWKWFLLCGILPFAILAKLSSAMNKICIHKDWLVVLSGGIDSEQTRLNASMRRIDLICSIAAPIFLSLIMEIFSTSTSSIFICVWSLVSGILEYKLNSWVFRNVPALHDKLEKLEGQEISDKQDKTESRKLGFIEASKAYYQHRVFLASFSYSMLYSSVLSWGGIMISFLKLLGISEVWLAVGRGIGAVIGVLATSAAPMLIQKMGLERAGLLSIWLQVICLAPVFFALIFMNSYSPYFAIIVFSSISSSRFGLWAFDIIETQIMQKNISSANRGLINGVQESCMNFGELCGFAMTMIFPAAGQFVYPGSISFCFVLLAAFLFSAYAYKWQQDNAIDDKHEDSF